MTDEELEPQGTEGSGPPAGIRLRGLHESTPQYANYLSINFDVYTFHLIFSRLVPVIIENDQDRVRFERSGWQADILADLLVPPGALKDIVAYLQNQLSVYESRYGTVLPASELSTSQDNAEEQVDQGA